MRNLDLLKSVEQIARLGSIRAAAEAQSITSTALNRQLISLEDELGQPLFERLPRGVRLNTAGEMFLIYARQQITDYERLKVQLADLSGVRRGHITVASTRAAIPYFLPSQINRYLDQHPLVSFAVNPCDIDTAQAQLISLEADIALIFEPPLRREFQIIDSLDQDIVAVFPAHHPLAASSGPVRLTECLNHPLALPARSTGVRTLLERAAQRAALPMTVAVESEDAQFLLNTVKDGQLLTFDIPLSLSKQALSQSGLAWRLLRPSDVTAGRLYIGQLANRTLSIAAMKFANQLISALQHHTSLCD
ncbi:MAG: LysR family transcriptional regulator [Pseudomonadota bacterium]